MTRLSILVLGALPLVAQKPMFPPVRGTREMVGAANNFEVEAGFRLLAQGGNAVDAGVAATLAAAVTEQNRFGFGGEMPLLIRMAGKPPVAISGVGTAPAAATLDYYRSRQPEPWEEGRAAAPIPGQGIRAAILPGVFDGLILALRKYGRKSFAEAAAPAIEYADAHPVMDEFALFAHQFQNLLDLWPTSRAYYFPNGKAPGRGEIFRQPDLARTLRELAAVEKKTRGKREKKLLAVRDHFYKGPIARRIAAFSQANGGLIAYEDLAKFSAEEDQPVCGDYRGYTVCKPGFWTQGPVMVQALNILEGYDLRVAGHNSPAYLHTVVEAVKLAFADRDRYYGDPKFAKIPAGTLLSKEYAAGRRKLIDPARASLEHRPGDFAPPLPSPDTGFGPAPGVHDTTCVNVVDREGNLFNATPSGAWLPGVIADDTGIPLSTRLQSFVVTEGHPNQLAPGKRPRVTLSPTMVLRDGKPWAILSTPGGDNQDQAMLQVLLNLIEFDMPPQLAVEAPRFQTEHFYSSFANHEFRAGNLSLETRLPKETAGALASMGHKVQYRGDWSNSSAPTLILIRDGVLDAGADPRRLRFVFGR